MRAMEKQKVIPNQITPFAVTNYRDIRQVFGIKEKNRRGHMYIIGKTGTGKSTLLANMVISDIQNGNGLALIDPHGDLAEEVLALYPPRTEWRISSISTPGIWNIPSPLIPWKKPTPNTII